ncbi:3-hydroxyacyl-ACP dehydratase [Chitinophaga sp. XS-30]|uniref:3-hydroxyacyl-ACP dehydratase n=1 Tax=Chitinophaga sp. XS-30 TaxID=2604421 RepID=UPI0011DD5219|nr:3-hydroxyacyl-ACP dehydratase [Chitinophaga sp. XS-30]QEH41406.1 3-hydroxyacyl-ACP dehydratase [Chitinophaga sp. XS-30]
MLAGKFYTIVTQQQPDAQSVHTTIALNAQHPIFEGHFPEQPVVPGVCMMQIIQELLSGVTGKKLLVEKAANMKFLNMIDPVQQPQVNVDIMYALQEDMYKATAVIKHEATVFMKFQGLFK